MPLKDIFIHYPPKLPLLLSPVPSFLPNHLTISGNRVTSLHHNTSFPLYCHCTLCGFVACVFSPRGFAAGALSALMRFEGFMYGKCVRFYIQGQQLHLSWIGEGECTYRTVGRGIARCLLRRPEVSRLYGCGEYDPSEHY